MGKNGNLVLFQPPQHSTDLSSPPEGGTEEIRSVIPLLHLRPATEGGISEVEIISQHIDEDTKSIPPVQLVNFAYRDLPLAAVDLSTAGSQLLSNLDEEYQREG
jgi:hypothetical protein